MASEVNYNDGKWHGWQREIENPLHPKTDIEMTNGADIYKAKAGHTNWGAVIAFRVIKEHKEPREFWQVVSQSGHVIEVFKEQEEAIEYAKGARGRAVIHVREVIDNG